MNAIVNKFRKLSLVGKAAVILVAIGAVGAVAMPKSPAQPLAEPAEVKAAQQTVTKEEVLETESIPFAKKTQNDPQLQSGTTKVAISGVNGLRTLTYEVTKTDGVITDKQIKKSEVTTAPVDEVTNIGTYVAPAPAPRAASNCDPNYSPCIPNVAYDLDCADIGYTVSVIGSDVHRLDRDRDGYGCE